MHLEKHKVIFPFVSLFLRFFRSAISFHAFWLSRQSRGFRERNNIFFLNEKKGGLSLPTAFLFTAASFAADVFKVIFVCQIWPQVVFRFMCCFFLIQFMFSITLREKTSLSRARPGGVKVRSFYHFRMSPLHYPHLVSALLLLHVDSV